MSPSRIRAPLARADLVATALVLVAALAFGRPRFRIGLFLGDEGFLAYGAVRVLAGELPHLDFVSLQPPLSFYTVAAAFEVWEPSLAVLRSLGLALHVAIALLVYAAARRLASPPAALCAALPVMVLGVPYHHFVPYAVWQGTAAVLLGVILTLRAGESRSAGWAVSAGGATALAVCLRHDQGFYLAAMQVSYAGALWLVDRGRPAAERSGPSARRWLVAWGCGLIVPLVPALLFWGSRGALPDMWAQLVVFPLTTYAKTSSLPMPGFDPGVGYAKQLVRAFFYFPPVVLGASAVVLFTRLRRLAFGRGEAALCFTWGLALLFYAQVLARSDAYHLVITLAPAFLLVAWLLDEASRRVRREAVIAVALASFAAFFFATADVFVRSVPDTARVVRGKRAGVLAPARVARTIENMIRWLDGAVPPDRSILVLPYEPMYYFLAERRNPTRWNYLWPGDQTPEEHRELVRQAQRDPPAAVLITGERLSRFAPDIAAWVRSGFEPARRYLDTVVYLPRDSTAGESP